MTIFRRRPEEAAPTFGTGNVGDDAKLAEIAAKSDLTAPRDWTHYFFCADEEAARLAAADIEAGGWTLQKVEPAAHGPGWAVVAECHSVVTSPDAVREAREFFEAIAARVEDGEYNGWEATV